MKWIPLFISLFLFKENGKFEAAQQLHLHRRPKIKLILTRKLDGSQRIQENDTSRAYQQMVETISSYMGS